MQGLVSLEGRLQKEYLLLAFDPFTFGIGSRLLIAVRLVQLHHLVDALLVLHFDLEFELQLMEHTGYLSSGMGCVSLDKVKVCERPGLGSSRIVTGKLWTCR
jgi:hypothetical protein